MQDDATLILTMLDQQFRYLLDQEKERRLLALPRLIRFLRGEPRVAALVHDLHEEAVETLAQLGREDAEVREKLSELWNAHQADVRRLLANVTEEHLNAFGSMDTYAASLQTPSVPTLQGDDAWPPPQPVSALRHWLRSAEQTGQEAGATVPEGFAPALTQLGRLAQVQQHQARRLKLAREGLAGPALARLAEVAEKLAPTPPTADADFGVRLMAAAQFRELDDFATLVHEPGRQESGHLRRRDIDAEIARVATDARLLHEELRQRVLVGQSRRALVRRYAARCEGFDAARLRKLAEGNTHRAEASLTLDFARYLFDQGLTPLIDATVGGLRPDVLDLAGPNVFYVEAKQYEEDYPKTRLRDAYRQVWGTWRRLRNPLHVPEAFLLVFRRGGRAVDLPPEVPYRGLVLHSMFVDLVDDSKAGSREKHPPLRLTEADLMPTDEDEPATGARRSAQKKGRRSRGRRPTR